MSDALAHYSFLPWLRQGIGAKITEEDAQGAPAATLAKERARLETAITVQTTNIADGSLTETTIPKTLKLYGPPDILSISERAIVRTEPKKNVNNYEANCFPYLEFFKEDLLWTHTPAAAGTGPDAGKLTPWLALICLKSDEFELKSTSDRRTYITINSDKIADVFHDETQHWAWAHVHLNTELTATTLNDQIAEVTNELAASPDSGVCRLLCPRKLIKETAYTAFVIPAFETGRLSGLGLDYTDVLAQKMSWGKTEDYSAKPQGTDYPVYYQWSFQTGLYGDFESLARILKAIVTDPAMGKRDFYIADAGYGLEDTPPDSEVIGLEGALKPPDFVSDPWTNGTGDVNYREHLRKLLNLSIDNEKKQTDDLAVMSDSLGDNPFYSATLGDDPIVTPPVYGRWHALVDRLEEGANYPWIDQLNLDPRNRATAGLGVTVIQKNQENYMQRAWKQVEQINEANEKIRKASLARMVNHAIHNKHLRFATTDQATRFTKPMHSFVMNSGKTITDSINKSLVPNASQSAAFKKITRPGKKSNKKINAMANTGATLIHQKVTEDFNDEAISTAKDKQAPALTIATGTVSSAITTSLSNYQSNDTAMAQQGLFDALLAETSLTGLEQAARKNVLKGRIDAHPNLNAAAIQLAKDAVNGIVSATDATDSSAGLVVIDTNPYKAVFGDDITAKSYENLIVSRVTGGDTGQIVRASLMQDILSFQSSFVGFSEDIISTMKEIPKSAPIANLGTFSNSITESLQPKPLMLNRINNAIKLMVYNPATRAYENKKLEDLKPVMAYPKFDDPTFRNLKHISQEYILPNIDKIPDNSITLMETNQAFIEAYMAGLNHEMSRELLWREFPTDQRGSYFRQFWDVSDNISETDPEKKYDIQKMHTWTGDLGDHPMMVPTSPTDSPYLVLLIRGELLKKYPNTQVYAQKAAFKDPVHPDAPRNLADSNITDNIKTPVFMAELDPDIYLFGFDLDRDEAKGDSSDATKPGWFFVMRERPGQIRFGLDDWTPTDPDDPAFPTEDPENWNDLSWEHLVNTASDLDSYQVDAAHSFAPGTGSANTPAATWGKNSADMAYILYQNPVLFARHGQEMLPD